MLILIFFNYKLSPRILRQHGVLRNLRKNKDIVITKPNKGNGVVILDQKFYNNAIEEIISDTSKFENCFLRKLKQKNFFNEKEYDKLYPSSSAPARIYVILKCTNSPLVIHFLNFVRLFRL